MPPNCSSQALTPESHICPPKMRDLDQAQGTVSTQIIYKCLTRERIYAKPPMCLCQESSGKGSKDMFFILINRSECRGKFSKMCPCHAPSCEYTWGVQAKQVRHRTAKGPPPWWMRDLDSLLPVYHVSLRVPVSSSVRELRLLEAATAPEETAVSRRDLRSGGSS